METIIVAIVSTIGVVATTLIQNSQKKQKDEIKTELEKMEKKIDIVAIGALKNFLVRTLAELDNGEKIDEAVKARIYETYDRYTKIYHQNSYIRDKWKKLRKEGKL